jgi:hypothetical protein
VIGVMIRTGWCFIRGTAGNGWFSGDAGGSRISESLGTGVGGAGGMFGEPSTKSIR